MTPINHMVPKLQKSSLSGQSVFTRSLRMSPARYSTRRPECDGREAPEDAVRLTVGARGEVDLVGVASGFSVADEQCPQAVDQDRLSLGIDHFADECTSCGIKCVDLTVAEIPDQNVAGKLTEACRGAHQAPRSIELPARGEPRQQMTAEVTSIQEAAAYAGYGFMHGLVLSCVGNEQHAIAEHDIERGITMRQVGIGERIRR